MIYVLDTNILSKAFSGRSRPTLERLMSMPVETVRLPTMVIAEIQYGVLLSSDPDGYRERWNRFLLPFGRLSFDEYAADAHAHLRFALRHEPIGDRDLVIAAVAVANRAVVVTNNRREFDRVPGLVVEDWSV